MHSLRLAFIAIFMLLGTMASAQDLVFLEGLQASRSQVIALNAGEGKEFCSHELKPGFCNMIFARASAGITSGKLSIGFAHAIQNSEFYSIAIEPALLKPWAPVAGINTYSPLQGFQVSAIWGRSAELPLNMGVGYFGGHGNDYLEVYLGLGF